MYGLCSSYVTLDTIAITEFKVVGTFSAIPDSVNGWAFSDSSTSGFTYAPDTAWQWRKSKWPLTVYIGGNEFPFLYTLTKTGLIGNFLLNLGIGF
jgi:hypothetical protein